MFPQYFLNYLSNFYLLNVSILVAAKISKGNFRGEQS